MFVFVISHIGERCQTTSFAERSGPAGRQFAPDDELSSQATFVGKADAQVSELRRDRMNPQPNAVVPSWLTIREPPLPLLSRRLRDS